MERQIHSAQPPALEQEHITRQAHTMRNLMEIAGVTLALMHAGPVTETADANHPNPDTPTPDQIRPNPSSLRGYNIPLSPETRKQGKEATVEIRKRYAGSSPDEEWVKDCTGVKTIVGGKVRVSTASHCFENLTGEHFGIIKSVPGQPTAANYIDRANGLVEYAVFDPQVDPGERKHKPLAKIDGISIAAKQDWALLSVAPLETPPEGVPRTFDQIPALKLAAAQSEAPPRPGRGQRVSLYGVFSANGEKQSTSIGRYLGRTTYVNEDGSIRYIDVVGLKPKTIAEDTCLPGSSGSSFTATSKGGITYMSGPMAGTTNETWGPAIHNNLPNDEKPNDVSNEIEEAKYWRAEFTRKLNVNTRSFSTICTFSANLPNSVNALNAGLETKAPEIARDDATAVGFESGKGGSEPQSMK